MFKDENQRKKKLDDNKKKEQSAIGEIYFKDEPTFLFGKDRTFTKAGYKACKNGNIKAINA